MKVKTVPITAGKVGASVRNEESHRAFWRNQMLEPM